MSHNQLWAPWRLSYIKTTDEPKPAGSGCFLCDYLESDASLDGEHFVVMRGNHSLVVLNRFPYNNGHLLVAPRAHKADLRDLSSEEILECHQHLQTMLSALERVVHPDGFNVGLNLGRVAGAGLPGHLHWHIVPRWNGDTNFMTVLGETTVIPQSLAALYELLTNDLSSESGDADS